MSDPRGSSRDALGRLERRGGAVWLFAMGKGSLFELTYAATQDGAAVIELGPGPNIAPRVVGEWAQGLGEPVEGTRGTRGPARAVRRWVLRTESDRAAFHRDVDELVKVATRHVSEPDSYRLAYQSDTDEGCAGALVAVVSVTVGDLAGLVAALLLNRPVWLVEMGVFAWLLGVGLAFVVVTPTALAVASWIRPLRARKADAVIAALIPGPALIAVAAWVIVPSLNGVNRGVVNLLSIVVVAAVVVLSLAPVAREAISAALTRRDVPRSPATSSTVAALPEVNPSQRRPASATNAMPGWGVRASDGLHRVELGKPSFWSTVPPKFTVDGIERSLGSGWRSRRTVSFEVAGRPAVLSISYVRPSWLRRFIRAFGDMTGSSMLVMWRYQLVVDGKSRGTWVAATEGQDIPSWRFFVAGRELPDFEEGHGRRQSATGVVAQGSPRRSIMLAAAGALLVGALDYSPQEYEGLAFAAVLAIALLGGFIALTWTELLALVGGSVLGGTVSSLSQLGQENAPSSVGASILGAAELGFVMVFLGGVVFWWRNRARQ